MGLLSVLDPLIKDRAVAAPVADGRGGAMLDANGHRPLVQYDRRQRRQPIAPTGRNRAVGSADRVRNADEVRVGIQVHVLYYPLGPFFAVYTRGGILATGAFDLAMFGYQNSPEPDDESGVFHSSQIPTAAEPNLGNYGRVRDPIIDSALTQGRDTVDFAQRVHYYHQFLEQLANQVYLIPLYTEVNIVVVHDSVRNFLPNPNVITNNWNLSDWWLSE